MTIIADSFDVVDLCLSTFQAGYHWGNVNITFRRLKWVLRESFTGPNLEEATPYKPVTLPSPYLEKSMMIHCMRLHGYTKDSRMKTQTSWNDKSRHMSHLRTHSQQPQASVGNP